MRRAIALLVFATLAAALPAQESEGRKLYQAHCAGCHGPNGEGARGADLTAPKLQRAPDQEAMFEVIRRGIPGTEMPPISTSILSDADVRQLVSYVLTLQRKALASVTGDRTRGEQLYQKNGCARCHTVGAEGGVTGPDLSAIGGRRGPAHLRTALLDPESYVPENFGQYRWYINLPDNFLQVRVVTRGGRRITGVRLNEDPFSIQLRDLNERVHSFWKNELRELHRDWGKSPMPSLKNVLSAAEIEDLVAYLVSLRGAR